MGTDTPKESTGPIRRFPNGFWTVFNQWWHGEFTRQGQRPSSKAIGKWHAENALKVWGENAVSYAETQRHANRMKCRRTTGHLLRQAAAEDDEDEEEYTDAPKQDVADGSAQPSAAEKQLGADSVSAFPGDRVLSGGNGRLNFGAHSDPPGALRRYMNADSDLPAPAAPCRKATRVQLTSSQPGTQASWMQPDPVSLFGQPNGLAQSSETGISSLSWNSSFSILRRSAEPSDSPPLQHNSAISLVSSGNLRAAKRCRDASQAPGGSAAQHPRANPFGEVAAAAAAAAGFPTTSAMPAARDAALLLNSAALAGPSPFDIAAPWAEPAWLQRAGQELDALMQELGVTHGDGGKLALPALMRKPRALRSSEPLRLPEPARKMDLDALLRRGLPRSTTEPAGAGSLACLPSLSRGPACQGPAEEQRVHARSCAQQAGGDVQPRSSWAAGPVGAGGAGLLTSIDCMPLEALLL